MSILNQSLWDDDFIKHAMEKIAKEERPMQSFTDTSSASTPPYFWGEPKKYTTKKVKVIIEEKEEAKQKPQFFDPKELDIDES